MGNNTDTINNENQAIEAINNETEKLFYDHGTVWFVSASAWSGQDRLTAEDIGVESDKILDIMVLGNKKILPKETRLALSKPRQQISSLMDRIGRHFLHFRGAWWVPNSKFMLAKTGLDQIKQTLQTAVDQLIIDLPEIKSKMIEEYPILDQANWPSNDVIRRKFSINVTVCQIQGLEPTMVDPEELMQAKVEFQQELKASYDEYKNQILVEAKQAIIEACLEIADKVKNGQKITESTMKKPVRIVEDYQNIASVFDMEDIKAEVAKLKEKLAVTSAATLTSDFEAAKLFTAEMRNAAKAIGDLSGLSSDGRIKRVVEKPVAVPETIESESEVKADEPKSEPEEGTEPAAESNEEKAEG